MDAMQFPNPAGYDQLAKGAMRTSFTRDAARRLGQAAADPERAREAAAGFESAFLHRLLDAMRATIPDAGLFESSSMGQYEDMFFFHLAETVAEHGGLGLGRQVYQQMIQHYNEPAATEIHTEEWK